MVSARWSWWSSASSTGVTRAVPHRLDRSTSRGSRRPRSSRNTRSAGPSGISLGAITIPSPCQVTPTGPPSRLGRAYSRTLVGESVLDDICSKILAMRSRIRPDLPCRSVSAARSRHRAARPASGSPSESERTRGSSRVAADRVLTRRAQPGERRIERVPERKLSRGDRETSTRLAVGDREQMGSGAATVIWIGRSLPPHIPRGVRASHGGDSAGAVPDAHRAAAHGEPRVRSLLGSMSYELLAPASARWGAGGSPSGRARCPRTAADRSPARCPWSGSLSPSFNFP
jgi:hypothetical protein